MWGKGNGPPVFVLMLVLEGHYQKSVDAMGIARLLDERQPDNNE
jgi:hypothetical protein